ncbi:hypothetical protein GW17_00008802, partial [Ensete ventricosum]
NMHSVAWRAVVMVATLLQICSSRELESNLSHPNRIIKLPGQPQVSFQQFSGYVTVDDRKHRALFYYFAEAEMDPSSKPLVLWLNGGNTFPSPSNGTISSYASFQKGKRRTKAWNKKKPKGEVLVRNEYSWNKVTSFPSAEANMLYLETPAGVGFSFSSDSSDYEGVNDQITGTNFLGNPVLEFSTDFNSRAEFFWSHGLISDSTYRIFTSACNYSRYVGGWTQVYGDVLAFATVRGASHEAPFSQPERSLVLFRAFLQGRPLPETFTYAP